MNDLPPAPPPPVLDVPGAGRPNGNGGRRGGYDRVPPHSLEAEVSVLGAALLSRNAANEVVEILKPDDFYRSAHRVVFEALQELMHRGEPCDAVTMLDWLARNGRLDEVGGAGAVHDLTTAVPTAANAVHYARIVREKSMLRRVIDAGTDIVSLGYESPDDATSVVDQAEGIVYEIAQSGVTSDYAQLKDLLNESFEQIEKLAENRSEVTGLATGFNDLDRLTAGLQPQNLVIIAARPAMGKCGYSGMRIINPKTGNLSTLGELSGRGDREQATVLSLGPGLELEAADVVETHDNGRRTTFKVTTRLGRWTRTTDNHPYLTPQGWRELRDLRPGDLVAVPRKLDVFGHDVLPEAEPALLGLLIGDGCLLYDVPVLTTETPAIVAEARRCAPAYGTRVTVTDKGRRAVALQFRSAAKRVTAGDVAGRVGVSTATVHQRLRQLASPGDATGIAVWEAADDLHYTGRPQANFLRERLQELGLWGRDSHTKFVPSVIFTAPKEEVAVFLSRLFATDGSAWVAEGHGYYGISYCSVSEQLIRDVQHLLLRFGVIARIREKQVKYVVDGEETRRLAYELEIRDAANCRRFIEEIGIFSKEEQCAAVLAALEARNVEHTNTDLLPIEIWDLILAEKGDRSWADVSAATGRPRNHNWHVGKRRPSRRLVAELAEALDSDRLRSWAHSDVYWDEIVSIEEYGVEPVYDLTIPELHNFVADDIVVHNSSLSLNLAQYVTVETRQPAIIFSLEMSKIEIVNRMLASEARIDSSRIKTGRLEDADWRKLGDALGRLSDAPLFIDDTPSITLMEIRSKCRRLKAKHGLELIIVDYLQLMASHRRVESRQQEVAEISRGLKMLAKELNVPVLALSQLSRQPEARTDKRPQLADLRESGCLSRSTRLFRADDGAPITFGELIDGGLRDVPVWASDDRGRLVAGRLTHAFSSGRKRLYRVRLASGMQIEATANHPFRTLEGWTSLGKLGVGSRVAAARRLAEPTAPVPMDPDEVVLLAHLIGEGTVLARRPLHYTSADPANLDAVEKAAFTRFGITARRERDGRSAVTTQLYLPAPYHLTHGRRNPIAAWLDQHGLWDRQAWQKRIPRAVFSLPDDQVRTFLHHLWSTDGCIWRRPAGQSGARARVHYATSSGELARDLQLLLLRLDIRARVREVPAAGAGRSQYHVDISDVGAQRRFLREVGCHGERGARIPELLGILDGIGLRDVADSDLMWDEIVEITDLGVHEVFDATVEEHHNFVADGLVVHNSIEQDADIVGFIYRDEVYDEDSPDKGMAELIIAKHRNGATGIVKLAFLSHLTKFANLSRGPVGGGPSAPAPAPAPPGVTPV